MKLILFVVIFCVVQITVTSSVVKSVSSALTDSNIDQLRQASSKSITGFELIDDFTDIFNNFRENATESEMLNGTIRLISLALNVDVSVINRTLVTNYTSGVEKAISENPLHLECFKDKKFGDLMGRDVSECESKAIEHAISKELTPAQTKQMMEIFHGFREGASQKENDKALFDLIFSATSNVLNNLTISDFAGDENVIIYDLS